MQQGNLIRAALLLALLPSLAHATPDPSPQSPPPGASMTPAPPVAAAAPQPSPAPPPRDGFARWESPYKLSLSVDIPVTLMGLMLWTVPYAIVTDELQGPFCNPCDKSKVNAFDRWATNFHEPWATTAADAILYATGPIALVLKLIDYGPSNYRGWLVDVTLDVEAVAWSGVFNEIYRRLVRRPRPYLYEPGVNPDSRTGVEATLSYYSGHTAAMFAISVVAAYTFHLRHPHSPLRYPVWIGLMALSTAEGMLRIFSGDHFPTDVLVGAAMGAGLGFLIPTLHLKSRWLPEPLQHVALVPTATYDQTGISLAGSF